MGILSLSSPLTPSMASLQLRSRPSLTFPNPKLCFLRPAPPVSVVSSSAKARTTPKCIKLSEPQSPATAMRGADTDAMGLLLKERIVFLGSGIDDLVADAIISQLLLLDAQDPKKDIRLFINCPGGSLRYLPLSSLFSLQISLYLIVRIVLEPILMKINWVSLEMHQLVGGF